MLCPIFYSPLLDLFFCKTKVEKWRKTFKPQLLTNYNISTWQTYIFGAKFIGREREPKAVRTAQLNPPPVLFDGRRLRTLQRAEAHVQRSSGDPQERQGRNSTTLSRNRMQSDLKRC